MSHSSGIVTMESDGKVFWFEYNGTSDVACPKIFETQDEMSEHWRNQGYGHDCKCGKEEDALIEAHYGGGIEWEGKVCRHCMVILNEHRIPTHYRSTPDDYGWGY